jgi:hypothetical protein
VVQSDHATEPYLDVRALVGRRWLHEAELRLDLQASGAQAQGETGGGPGGGGDLCTDSKASPAHGVGLRAP